ncbi:MAG: hypothetical protein U5K27_01090 [Desulfotignum sp.]|nr:hypothetical protein [Desulfotignum sp.]
MEEQRLMKLRTLCGENAIEIEERFESEGILNAERLMVLLFIVG